MPKEISIALKDEEDVKIEDQEKRLEKLEEIISSLKGSDSDKVKVVECGHNTEDFIAATHKRYASSLTIHGLNHILEGTKVERIAWSVKVALAISIAIILSWNLCLSYFSYEVATVYTVIKKKEMQHPVVHLCQERYYKVVGSYDAPSPGYGTLCDPSTTYSTRLDKKLTNVSAGVNGTVKCPEGLHQQCFAINTEGRAKQTSQYGRMRFSYFNTTFPIRLFVSTPNTTFLPREYFHYQNIERPGFYFFKLSLTKLQRQPTPYSKPSCVVEGSPESQRLNIFKGKYTAHSCLNTCEVKLQLQCGGLKNWFRGAIRETYKFTTNSTDYKSINKCKAKLKPAYYKCLEACNQACVEENYHMAMEGYTRAKYTNKTLKFRFEFLGMKETLINEEPKYHLSTFMSNVGGALGLMTGLSALSVSELIICLTLYIIKRKKEKN